MHFTMQGGISKQVINSAVTAVSHTMRNNEAWCFQIRCEINLTWIKVLNFYWVLPVAHLLSQPASQAVLRVKY